MIASRLKQATAKFKGLGKKKLIALVLVVLMVALPLFALASPDVREIVAKTLGISAEGTTDVATTSGISPLTGWTGTRIPAAYEPTTPGVMTIPNGSRFNAVTGEVITSASWDPHDFSAFPETAITIATTTGVNVIQRDAMFRLDPTTTPPTAELARLPQGVNATLSGSAINMPAANAVTIPSEVTHNGTTYVVVSIGSHAIGATEAEVRARAWHAVTVPDTVTHIRESAFRNFLGSTINSSSNLVYLGNNAFQWRASMGTASRNLTIQPRLFPEGLKEAGAGNVDGRNIGNTNVTLPESLEVVRLNDGPMPASASGGNGLFAGVTGATTNNRTLTFPSDWTHIPPRIFGGGQGTTAGGGTRLFNAVEMHDGITHIHYRAFYRSDNHNAFRWPANLEYIGGNAFGLVSFTGEPAVTAVLDFPPSMRVIGDSAFSSVSYRGASEAARSLDFTTFQNLEVLGTNVWSSHPGISGGAAAERPRLNTQSVQSIPSHWTVIPAGTFSYAVGNDTVLDLSHTDIRYIGNRAFIFGLGESWSPAPPPNGGFISFVPPPNLEWIGNEALRQQDQMRGDLILPEGLRHIGHEAFMGSGWDGILYIPRSVTTFGHRMVVWPGDFTAPLNRAWVNTNFSRIEHHRFVRQMEGSLPSVDDRFTGTPVTDGWEDTYSISTTDPVLYKSARWTDNHL
ncbi:MAG: leucine-rich repeat domain-containing protein, partial [Coriobacteriia bacterium]|nr:leucine-rich repeat domain-containing protein [Coriobacteriia bacterium]